MNYLPIQTNRPVSLAHRLEFHAKSRALLDEKSHLPKDANSLSIYQRARRLHRAMYALSLLPVFLLGII